MLIDGDVSYHHLIAWAVDQLKADDVFFWPKADISKFKKSQSALSALPRKRTFTTEEKLWPFASSLVL
jgi:hypothetical protein